MALHLLLALVLIAGSAHTSYASEKSLLDINWDEILGNLPGILETIQEIIADIEWTVVIQIIQNIISTVPDIIPGIIDNYPGIIENLPNIIGSLPSIVATIPEYIVEIDWDAVLVQLPEINWSAVVENLPEIVANLPQIIANLPEIIENLPEIDWGAIIAALPEIVHDPGVASNIIEYPSLVQIEVSLSSIWVMGCSGSILSSRYVLSAGRCFYGRWYDPYNRRIRAGANNRGIGGDVYYVSSAVTHPSFGSNHFEGDIAVVTVLGLIYYSPVVQSIPITSQGVFFPAGVRLNHAGWGATAEGKTISNQVLHQTDLYVVGNAQCADRYRRFIVPISITDNMICAGRLRTGGRKTDLRDAGGPVYYQGILVGVVSMGHVGNHTYPVVASSVSAYSNWIVATAA